MSVCPGEQDGKARREKRDKNDGQNRCKRKASRVWSLTGSSPESLTSLIFMICCLSQAAACRPMPKGHDGKWSRDVILISRLSPETRTVDARSSAWR